MPDMSLAAQARRRLQAEGAPISKYNLEQAMRELETEPSLKADASSENRMIDAMGGSTGKPDRSGKGSGGFGVYDPDYEAPNRPNSDVKGDRYYSSASQMTSGPQQGQGGNANQSRKGQGGNAGGATPGSPTQSVSTEPEIKTTELPAPAPSPTDTTRAELNAVSRPSRSSPTRREPPMLPVPQQSAHRPPSPTVEVEGGGMVMAPPGAVPPEPSVAQGVGLNPAGAATIPGGVQSAFPGVGQTAQGLPPTPAQAPGPGMLDQIMAMLPEGTGQRAQNVAGLAATLGPLAMAFLGRGAAGGGRAGAGGPQMRPRAAPTGLAGMRTPGGPSAAAMPETMPPNALVPNPMPPPGLTMRPNPQPPMSPMAPTPEPYGPQMPLATPDAMGTMRLGRFATEPLPAAPVAAPAVQQSIGPALQAAAPKVAPVAPKPAPTPKVRPGGGRPAEKRAENKTRTTRRQARAKSNGK